MSKYKVGDNVLRSGHLSTKWRYTIIALKGRLWWRKAILQSGRDTELFFEEYLYNLYPMPPLAAKARKRTTTKDTPR